MRRGKREGESYNLNPTNSSKTFSFAHLWFQWWKLRALEDQGPKAMGKLVHRLSKLTSNLQYMIYIVSIGKWQVWLHQQSLASFSNLFILSIHLKPQSPFVLFGVLMCLESMSRSIDLNCLARRGASNGPQMLSCLIRSDSFKDPVSAFMKGFEQDSRRKEITRGKHWFAFSNVY